MVAVVAADFILLLPPMSRHHPIDGDGGKIAVTMRTAFDLRFLHGQTLPSNLNTDVLLPYFSFRRRDIAIALFAVLKQCA